MIRRWLHSGLILVLFASGLRAQDRQTLLPNLLRALQDTPGFEAAGAASQYDSGKLDEFDRSLASALKLYGARGVGVQEGKMGGGAVKVTLLQMLDSPAAYGIYTRQRSMLGGESTPTLIGAASFRHRNQLYFWQSNYVVRIDAPAASQNELAQSLSRSILGRSQKPPVSEYLPAANLVEGTEKYLLSTDSIDRAVGIDPDKLGFDSSAEAASATYRLDGKLAHLLLVLYPTPHIAKRYAEDMEAAAKTSAAFRKRAGPLVAIVYGPASENTAASILNDVSHELKVTWDEPPPGLGLGTMLITIFTFIGVALVFTTIVGISYGGLRIFVKSRFPNRVFDRPEAMELIQLKLVQGVTDRQIEGDGGTGSV